MKKYNGNTGVWSIRKDGVVVSEFDDYEYSGEISLAALSNIWKESCIEADAPLFDALWAKNEYHMRNAVGEPSIMMYGGIKILRTTKTTSAMMEDTSKMLDKMRIEADKINVEALNIQKAIESLEKKLSEYE